MFICYSKKILLNSYIYITKSKIIIPCIKFSLHIEVRKITSTASVVRYITHFLDSQYSTRQARPQVQFGGFPGSETSVRLCTSKQTAPLSTNIATFFKMVRLFFFVISEEFACNIFDYNNGEYFTVFGRLLVGLISSSSSA